MHRRTSLVVAFLILLGLMGRAAAEDWLHWRGARRDDVTKESSGFKGGEWLTKEPAWTSGVGIGGSSPIVVGDRVYALGWFDKQDHVNCINLATGKKLWTVSYKCKQYGSRATGDEGLYSGSSATPEFDAETGLLYTLSVDGDLNCWDTKVEGKQVWSLNLYAKYAVARRPKVGRSGLRDYGYTTSPLIHGEWVIVEVGDDEGTLMAFDRRTGERQWASEYRGPAGHTGGLAPITVEDVPCVAVMTFDGLLVARLDKDNAGKTVAFYDWRTEFGNNIASPTVHGDHVLITSGYNHEAMCKLKITLKGATKVWQVPQHSLVCSPVVHKGKVYVAWQKLRCLDFETGKQLWEGGNYGDAGSLIATADDRLIAWGGRGRVALVESAERSPKEYRELAKRDSLADSDVWPHAVLAGGRLLLKDRGGRILCFVVEKEREK